MGKSITLSEFLKRYKSDRDCLKEIVNIRWPNGITCRNCNTVTPHYLLKIRPVLTCKICKTQTYPTKGTIFEHSTTSLKLWFYAMFVMIHTRAGISAKQLQREIGVSYPTAFRMFHQIRKLMADNSSDLLKGETEIDEVYLGGRGLNRGRIWWANWEEKPKEIVMGFIERGGRVRTKHVQDTSVETFITQVRKNVSLNAKVYTDQHPSYLPLKKLGYYHKNVNHSIKFVRYDENNNMVSTNSIEGFWSQLKRGLVGTYRHSSKKYLQNYCNEFAFRFSNRNEDMFGILLENMAK